MCAHPAFEKKRDRRGKLRCRMCRTEGMREHRRRRDPVWHGFVQLARRAWQ